MTFSASRIGHRLPFARPIALLYLIGLGGAILFGTAVAQEPILAVGALAVALLALVVLAWPDAPTLAVIFILYTNAAVIAVRFHGMPFTVGAAVPVLLIIPLANLLVFRREKLRINTAVMLMFVFLGIKVAGTLFSAHPDISVVDLITFATEGFGLYFLIFNTTRSLKMIRVAIWVLLLAGTFLGFLSVYQQATQTFSNDYGGFAQMSNAAFGTGVESLQGEIEQRRLAGPLGDQNYYAQIMLTLVPLGLFEFWGAKSKLLRVLALITIGFILGGAVLTFSRGAAVGFALMLLIMTFLRYIKLYQLALTALVLVLVMQAFPQYATRLNSLQALSGAVGDDGGTGIQAADNSTKSRLTEMGAASLVAADYPLVGVGPGLFKYYYPAYADAIGLKQHSGVRAAHDLYLEIAAENGVLGLLCFLAIVFVSLRDLVRTRERWLQSRPEMANVATGFILAIVTFLATAVFLSFAYERYFWLILALGGATSSIARSEAFKVSRLNQQDTRPFSNA
ncbi:MAG: O-antigen ligase family protein [Ardenticatenaceae bacterium]|nr:O-antigen ligase family protein [Ardenticatenaceae bacterium]HBY96456.1 hypothetical protein [Chloroflexota bacterium]